MGGHLAQDEEPQPQLTAKLKRKKAVQSPEGLFLCEGDGGPQPSFKIRGSFLFCREKPSEVVARKAVHRLRRWDRSWGACEANPQNSPEMDQGFARPQSGGEEGRSWTRTVVRARSPFCCGCVGVLVQSHTCAT